MRNMYLYRSRKLWKVRFFTFLITSKCSVQVIAGMLGLGPFRLRSTLNIKYYLNRNYPELQNGVKLNFLLAVVQEL